MRHRKGYELLPVLRTREPPSGFQPFVERRRWQWRHQAEDRQPRRPTANFLQSSLRYARLVIVHTEDKRGDGITLRWASRPSTSAYSPGLLKPFFTSARLAGSMDSIPMKIHLPPEAAIRSTSSSSRSRLALICATQCTCALAAMMSRSNDFVRFTLMAKLSSIKKTAIWPPSSRARAFSSNNSFTTLSLVRNRMESPKNPVTVQNSHP